MPLRSKWTVPIPEQSLPDYVFTSPTHPLNNSTPLLMDARAPNRYYLTKSSYRLWCQRFAAGLRKAGLRKGDRVLLYSGNTIFFPVVLLGTIMAGGIFTGANPMYIARELAYQLRDSGAMFLITSDASIDTALEAAREVGLSEDRIFVFDDGVPTCEGQGRAIGRVRHWTSLVAPEEVGKKFVWDQLRPEDLRTTTVTLNYSSGTTGVPKGVEVTHRNYVSNAVQMDFQARLDSRYEERVARARFLCFLPMYHAMAQTIFGVNALRENLPVYLMTKFDFIKMLEYIENFRITYLVLVPPIVVAMAKDPRVKKYNLSSVEIVGSGAAPLGREVCVELERLWPEGQVNVKQGWGMTEVTCSAMGWHPEEHSDSFSVGELNANCEARVMADDGVTEVGQGERGEIWIRGPNVMKGYWKKPEATRETITPDGWLKTGDIAYYDKNRKWFIVDRKKELIKVKGNQVAPAELEAILLDHEAIADAAVIGVTVGHDEHPRAYVVLQKGKRASEQDIQEFMKKHVTKTKWLTGGVRFLELIPKNPSGKILRKLLRDQAKAEAESPVQARL